MVIREIKSIYFKCKTQAVIDYNFEFWEKPRLFIIFNFYPLLKNVDSVSTKSFKRLNSFTKFAKVLVYGALFLSILTVVFYN